MFRAQTLILALAAATFSVGSANAVVVTPSFDYVGQTNVEGNVTDFDSTSNPPSGFPPGGTFTATDGSDISDSYGIISGDGSTASGLTFNAAASSYGEASASSRLTVTVQVTNDEASAQQITWNGLIFAGGAGIIQPNFFSSGCDINELSACGEYLAPNSPHGASATLGFGASFEGADLFGGDIFVDDNSMSAAFSPGFGLENLRVAPTNDQFYWWDDTTFTIDLGVFAANETKTLTFFVTASTIASGQDGCTFSTISPDEFIFCTGAQVGFGDPDSMGGLGGGGNLRSMSFAFTSAPPPDVPVPGAVWLFLTGLGGLAGAKKLKKKSA